MSSGIPLTLVDLGSSRETFITREEVEELKSTSTIGRLAVQILRNWFRRDSNRLRFEFYDPLALASAMRPELITVRQFALGVETADQIRLGESKVESIGGPVSVVEDVDVKGFSMLFYDLFALTRS